MARAEICTPWTGTGADGDPNRPQVADDYSLLSWIDSTGQPVENLQPDPNLYCVVATMEDAVLDAIEADATYQVLWSEAL